MASRKNIIISGVIILALAVGGYVAYKSFSNDQRKVSNIMGSLENQYLEQTIRKCIANPGDGSQATENCVNEVDSVYSDYCRNKSFMDEKPSNCDNPALKAYLTEHNLGT